MIASSETIAMRFLLFLLIAGVVLPLLIWLAGLPGRIARQRGHRNQDAIALCGYVGIVLWPAWVVALIWAHTDQRRYY